ncbi:MAG: response regulator [Candidatus Eremiobacteraeota bacterium]|nr:response regulator [Candidatus Eremiobacteraeota bacterium]
MATVLVADDSTDARLLVRVVLESRGHTVMEAGDGEDAWVRASQIIPDLIVVDLSLPTLAGTELIRRVRGDPNMRRVRVALYTATTANPAIRDFMRIYGVRHIVPKPTEPQALLEKLEEALRD